MAYALAAENEEFIARMIRQGRFNSQSEVVREALRRMERAETAYLNPPPLSREEEERIFSPDASRDRGERLGVRASARALRRRIQGGKLALESL